MEQETKSRPGTFWGKQAPKGVTLLEILMAMLILGLVTGGIFTAFVTGRHFGFRTEAYLMVAQGFSQEIAEQLRLSTAQADPNNDPLPLAVGTYVDPDYPVAERPPGAIEKESLRLPASFNYNSKYKGKRRYKVENALDFDGDGQFDLKKVTITLEWTVPVS